MTRWGSLKAVSIGSSMGNPGVRQANPDPYPQYPVPLSRVPGITGRGQGFQPQLMGNLSCDLYVRFLFKLT
jgi:hypothetical protein